MKLQPRQNKKQWNRWFAWYPVDVRQTLNEPEDRRWLEWVERKEVPGIVGACDLGGYIYRTIPTFQEIDHF